MTKSDLRNGMVVKLRDGSLMMVVNEMLVEKDCNLSLNKFNNNFIFNGDNVYDIMAIYEISDIEFVFNDLRDHNCDCLSLIWERVEVKLTEDMKTLLRLLPQGKYNYLTRNDTRGGTVKVHQAHPDSIDNETWQTSCFVNGEWTSDYERSLELYSHIFEILPKGVCIKISDYI